MTQREAFEAWWQSLESNYPCYGEENHKAIAMNAWWSAQAAQAQDAMEPVAFLETITGQVRLPDDEHRVRFPKAYEPLYKTTQVAPGDIRALKYRIHELEGEVIGYKRILDEQAARVQTINECADILAEYDCLNSGMGREIRALIGANHD